MVGDRVLGGKNVESLKIVKKENLNLNMFIQLDGNSADVIARAKPTDILIIKIEHFVKNHKSYPSEYGLQITKADIFTEDVFDKILTNSW